VSPRLLIGWAISQEYPERQEWTDRDELLVHEVFLRERQAFDEGPSLLRLIPRGIIMWYRWVPQALDVATKERLHPQATKFTSPLTHMVVLYGTIIAKERAMAKASMSKRRQKGGEEAAVRERILEAAFAAFMKSGYATTSTLEIATRARVSKRELYALVGNKQEMLIACISERARRFDVPADLPVLRDRKTLEQVLTSFGTKLVREVTDPTVIAVFRLAIAEAVQAPEVARALDSMGRQAGRAALRKIMAEAQASGLLTGRPAELAEQFAGAALARFDGQPAARRRRATEPPRNRETCPRRRSRLPATSSATERRVSVLTTPPLRTRI
jgi:AcrR family transcriptional regulator